MTWTEREPTARDLDRPAIAHLCADPAFEKGYPDARFCKLANVVPCQSVGLLR